MAAVGRLAPSAAHAHLRPELGVCLINAGPVVGSIEFANLDAGGLARVKGSHIDATQRGAVRPERHPVSDAPARLAAHRLVARLPPTYADVSSG